jgi:hypothetical protein
MPDYAIQTELAHRFDPGRVQLDLSTDHGRRLRELDLHVTATPSGRALLTLTVTAADLWTAVLTCMGLLDHERYELTLFRAQSTLGTAAGRTHPG